LSHFSPLRRRRSLNPKFAIIAIQFRPLLLRRHLARRFVIIATTRSTVARAIAAVQARAS
jgi:hypothetical protein